MQSSGSSINFDMRSEPQSNCVCYNDDDDDKIVVNTHENNNSNNSNKNESTFIVDDNNNNNCNNSCATGFSNADGCDEKIIQSANHSAVVFASSSHSSERHQAAHFIERRKRDSTEADKSHDDVNAMNAEVVLHEPNGFVDLSTCLSPITATSALPCLFTPLRAGASADCYVHQSVSPNQAVKREQRSEVSFLETTEHGDKQKVVGSEKEDKQKKKRSVHDVSNKNITSVSSSRSSSQNHRLVDSKNGGSCGLCVPNIKKLFFFKALRTIFRRGKKKAKYKVNENTHEQKTNESHMPDTVQSPQVMESRNFVMKPPVVCAQNKRAALSFPSGKFTKEDDDDDGIQNRGKEDGKIKVGDKRKGQQRDDECQKVRLFSSNLRGENVRVNEDGAKQSKETIKRETKNMFNAASDDDNNYEKNNESVVEEDVAQDSSEDVSDKNDKYGTTLRGVTKLPDISDSNSNNTAGPKKFLLAIKKLKRETESELSENNNNNNNYDDGIKSGDDDSVDEMSLSLKMTRLSLLDATQEKEYLPVSGRKSSSSTHLSAELLDGPQAATLPTLQQSLQAVVASARRKTEEKEKEQQRNNCGSRTASGSEKCQLTRELYDDLFGVKSNLMSVTSDHGNSGDVDDLPLLCENGAGANYKKHVDRLGSDFNEAKLLEKYAEPISPFISANMASKLRNNKNKVNLLPDERNVVPFMYEVPDVTSEKREQKKRKKMFIFGKHVPHAKKINCGCTNNNNNNNNNSAGNQNEYEKEEGNYLRRKKSFTPASNGSYVQIAAKRRESLEKKKKRKNITLGDVSKKKINSSSEDQKSFAEKNILQLLERCLLSSEVSQTAGPRHSSAPIAAGVCSSSADVEKSTFDDTTLGSLANEFASRYLLYGGLTWREFKAQFYSADHLPFDVSLLNNVHLTEPTLESCDEYLAALASLLRPSCAACGPNEEELRLLHLLKLSRDGKDTGLTHISRDWLYERLPPQVRRDGRQKLRSAQKGKVPFDELKLSTKSPSSIGSVVPTKPAAVLADDDNNNNNDANCAPLVCGVKMQKQHEREMFSCNNNNSSSYNGGNYDNSNDADFIRSSVHSRAEGTTTPSVFSLTSSIMRSAFSRLNVTNSFRDNDDEYEQEEEEGQYQLENKEEHNNIFM